jgi:phosphoribosylglycinamide formyltransferase-1
MTAALPKIAFFISGGGGNALNLLQACREGRVPAEAVLAVASTAKAPGIQRLREAGMVVATVDRVAGADDAAYSETCFRVAEAAGADIICLAGWLKRLVIPGSWEGRILNIHPSLLPAFGGAGMYGLHVHRAVLAAGVPESGCTVHLVDEEFDHGRILAQARVPVLPGDSPEALRDRVYAQEMRLYPEALAACLAARI